MKTLKTKLGEGATPEPWYFGSNSMELLGPNYQRLATISPKAHGDFPYDLWPDERAKAEANARLIVKAPLLVEARDTVELALSQLEGTNDTETAIDATIKVLRALLARLEEA